MDPSNTLNNRNQFKVKFKVKLKGKGGGMRGQATGTYSLDLAGQCIFHFAIEKRK